MHLLPAEPSWERKAFNRCSFGCREVDELYVQQIGWEAWVEEQLNVPEGDDSELATYLNQQTLYIEYEESNEFNSNQDAEGWDAVEENRPLNYLSYSEENLYGVLVNAGNTHPWNEVWRVYEEEMNSVYMRAAHSNFQLREVMTDFWLNHFSVWYDGDDIMRLSILIYDRDVIRPRVFGNFRDMLGAVAHSTAMQWYLDNARSPAELPNENYARELMELHTLGEDAYLGTVSQASVERNSDGIAVGFTDQDVIEVSRAFSGWTVEYGQWGGDAVGNLPYTWLPTYNPYQHNNDASMFMGVNLAPLSADMAQGERVLDILADHPATADFVVTKMVKRFFGENPPQAVVDRAVTTWMDNRSEPDQIRRVVESILLDGTEIGDEAPTRLRRPFEKMVATWRVMGGTINASWVWTWISRQTNDAAFDWPSPDGRPDNNDYWLAGTQVMAAWNAMYDMPWWGQPVSGNLLDEMPEDATDSAIAMTDFWVARMIGYEIASTEGYNELVDFTFHWAGPMSQFNWMQDIEDPAEKELQRQQVQRSLGGFCALIATADEFAWV